MKNRQLNRPVSTASKKAPSAPTAPDCEGVAQPMMIDPSTSATSASGRMRPRRISSAFAPAPSGQSPRPAGFTPRVVAIYQIA